MPMMCFCCVYSKNLPSSSKDQISRTQYFFCLAQSTEVDLLFGRWIEVEDDAKCNRFDEWSVVGDDDCLRSEKQEAAQQQRKFKTAHINCKSVVWSVQKTLC